MDTKAIISKFKPRQENLINILHELQNANQNNYLLIEDLKLVADYLNITYSSVYGVVQYYSMFSINKRGKNVIRVCKSPVCHMINGKSVLSEIKQKLGIGIGEVTEDQLFSVETSECLGHCDKAPVMMINDQVYTNLDSEKIKNIFKDFKNK